MRAFVRICKQTISICEQTIRFCAITIEIFLQRYGAKLLVLPVKNGVLRKLFRSTPFFLNLDLSTSQSGCYLMTSVPR